jgi:raffinose/stachyose/melibiose transport system permease protein
MVATYGVLLLLTAAALGPTAWVVLSSFSRSNQIYNGELVPSSLSLNGYETLFASANLAQAFANTVLYATLGTLVAVVAGFLAAYPTVRVRFPLRGFVTVLFTASLAIPITALIVPEYHLWTTLGLYDTKLGLVVFYAGLFFPLTFVILRAYLARLPAEIEESARMDGAGYFTVLWRIVTPLVRPALATVAIVDFISIWNEFLFALVLAPSPTNTTLQVQLSTFKAQFQFEVTAMLAGTVVVMAVPIVAFLLLQRQVMAGLTAGAGR